MSTFLSVVIPAHNEENRLPASLEQVLRFLAGQAFTSEVVIVENGQGRGSLRCDTSSSYGGDTSVRANANDESHSFVYLVEQIFRDRRVSATLLDPIRSTFIGADDHSTNGYRRIQNVSYPCFNTTGGRRVEMREGIWTGAGHDSAAGLESIAGWFRSMRLPLSFEPGGAIHFDRHCGGRIILRCRRRACQAPAAMQSRRWRRHPATAESARKRAAGWRRPGTAP